MTTYDLATGSWRNMLNALTGMLAKAEQHDLGASLLSAQLAPDMLPLSTQLRFVANLPGEGLARLAAIDFVSREDDPKDFAEAKALLTDTLALLERQEPSAFLADDAMIDMTLPNGMSFRLSAQDYVRDWALPNFYFHVTTAYAIMRSKGVALGKADLVPHMGRHMTQAG